MRNFLWIVLCSCILQTGSLLAQMNFTLVGTLDYPLPVSDIWGYTATGTDTVEYALMGIFNGTAVISLLDPAEPTQTAFIPGPHSLWRDVKTFGSRAYVSNETGNGIAIINLSALPSGSVIHHYVTPVVPGLGQITTAHNLWIDELGYLYVAGSNLNSGGVIIFDVFTQPDTPVYVGMGPPVYSHDVYARGNVMYSADIYQGYFSVYDITQRSSPYLLNIQSTDYLFTHNVWLSDNGNTLFTTDELANAPVGIFDVSDPFNIVRLGAFRPSGSLGQGVIPHNAHVDNDFVVISYYTDGVVVFDGKRPHNPVEVGVYDTYPGPSGGFNGAWGAFPFLPSGLVLASDMQSGLFVLEPYYQRACWIEGKITDAQTGQPLHAATVTIDSVNVETSSNLFGDYATGYAFAGNYTLNVALPGYDTFSIAVQLTNDSLVILDIELVPVQCSVEITCPVPLLYYFTDSGYCHKSLIFEALPSGNCALLTMQYTINNNPVSFPHIFPLGLSTVNAQVTDVDSNTTGCSFNVFVIDQEPPFIDCPQDTTLVLTEGDFAVYVELPAALYSDNCSSVFVNNSFNAQGDDASGFYPPGIHTVHFIATDGSGNNAGCSTTVIILPSLNLNCIDSVTGFLLPDTCSALVDVPVPLISGGIAPYQIENNIFPGQQDASGYYPPGETIITYTVTDNAGNHATCSTILYVSDTLLRPLICLPDTILYNDPGLCGATVEFEVEQETGCYAQISIWPESGSIFPLGSEPVSIIATGWGGITDSCTFTVTVLDTEAPWIDCPPDTIVYIGFHEPGTVLSLPSATASDNCNFVDISNSFSGASPHVSGFFSTGLTQIFFQASDNAQNISFCNTQVWVIPDSTVPTYTLSGQIKTSAGTPLPSAKVIITGSADTLLWTDSMGTFVLDEVYHGASLNFEALLDAEPLWGITTYDIVMIQNHILNVAQLPGPYAKIAADVNSNGIIEVGDMVQLRRLLLMYDSTFTDPFSGLPNNTSWRFPLPGLTDSSPGSPLVPVFEEQYQIIPVQASVADLNFVAVKIGDIDQSALLDMTTDESSLYRHPPVVWNVKHLPIDGTKIPNNESINILENNDQRHKIMFASASDLNAYGFQIALGPLPESILELSVTSSLPGWSSGNYHHFQGEKNYLLISFNYANTIIRAGEPVFEISFSGSGTVCVSDWMITNNKKLVAEIYFSSGGAADVLLVPNQNSGQNNPAQAILYPNPATNHIYLHYTWPIEEQIIFEIHNATGSLVLREKWMHTEPLNLRVTDTSSLLPGMYYGTLRGYRQALYMPLFIIADR